MLDSDSRNKTNPWCKGNSNDASNYSPAGNQFTAGVDQFADRGPVPDQED